MEDTLSRKLDIDSICKLLFESAAEGLLVTCEEGYIHLVNPRLEEMFGYSKDELIGKKLEALIPSHHRKTHVSLRKEYHKQPVKRSMGANRELSGRRSDGSSFPLEVSLNHFPLDGSTMVMALVSDITERKKSEKRIRLYASIVEHMQSGVLVFRLEDPGDDRSLKLIAFNPAAQQLTGLNENYILHSYIDEVFPNSRRQNMPALLASVILSGSMGSDEDFLYRDDRIKEKTWALKVFALPDNCVGISFDDISQRHKAEEDLREWNEKLEQKVRERTRALEDSQHLYRLIARNFPNGVINVFDRNLNYVFVEGMNMFRRGITGEMLIGTSFLDRIEPAFRDDIRTRLMSVMDGHNVNFEMKIGKKTYMFNAVGLPNKKGEIIQILMVSQNISRLKRAEENIQQSLAKEKHLNELKSRFVAMASHEFRTPLTTVMNSVSLLARYIGTEGNENNQKRHINRIRTSVHHLTSILNDFLSLDKLEEGKIELSPGNFDLVEFSGELVDEVNGISKAGQTIQHSHEGETHVTLDRQMLKSIFNNLLSNAIKYSPENTLVKLETRLLFGELIIVVEDSGIGIPEEEQEHLFERFFRARNALNIEGTGLGLNIVKKYMNMVNGEIDFSSKPGKGTRFTLKIPLKTAK